MSVNTRGTNFIEKDKTILIGIVDKYKNVVECKKPDGKTNCDKKEICKAIVKEFNAISESRRTAHQLQIQWKNTKAEVKKKYI